MGRTAVRCVAVRMAACVALMTSAWGLTGDGDCLISQLFRAVSVLSHDLQALKIENEALKATSQEIQTRMIDLQTNLSLSLTEMRGQVRQLENLTLGAVTADLWAAVSQLHDDLNKSTTSLHSALLEITENAITEQATQQELHIATNELKQSLIKLNASSTETVSRLEATNGQVTELQEFFMGLNATSKETVDQLKSANKEIGVLQEHFVELNATSKETVNQLKTANDQIGNLQNTTTQLKEQLEGLETKATEVNATTQNNTELPLAHLYGSITSSSHTLASGSTIKFWTTDATAHPIATPILLGGMQYSSATGFITVPKNGIYYVYAKLKFDPNTAPSGNQCGYSLHTQSKHLVSSSSTVTQNNGLSQYVGQVTILERGDNVFVQSGACRYYANSGNALFGAFLLS